MRKLRAGLATAFIAAFALRIIWWAIAPLIATLIPALGTIFVLVVVFGALYYRRRW
jgi:hypothetical protein